MFRERLAELKRRSDVLTKYAVKVMEDKKIHSLGWSVQEQDEGVYSTSYWQVLSTHIYIVDLNNRQCICKEYQEFGIPCCHVMAVIANNDFDKQNTVIRSIIYKKLSHLWYFVKKVSRIIHKPFH